MIEFFSIIASRGEKSSTTSNIGIILGGAVAFLVS